MNYKSTIKILIGILCISLVSCKKYLDKAPDTLYAYPTTVKNLQAMMDNPQSLNESKTPSFPEASADDFFVTDSMYDAMYIADRQAYIWEIPDFTTSNDWRTAYGPIYIANVAIENIDKIPKTLYNKLEWDNVKGSAYFFRAYYFLQLIWTYSLAYDENTAGVDLGVVLRKTTDINVPSIRSTVKESYQQIIDDALIAAEYLPELSAHPLRPSKAAAYALLARTYLSMRDYEKAYEYSDLSLQIKNELIDFNKDNDVIGSFNSANPPFRQYNRETIFYTEISPTLVISFPVYSFIDSSLYSSFENNDLRKSAFFTGVGHHKSFKGTYTQNIYSLFSGIATDEVYLIRAECNARLGDKNAALNDLNVLLKNRINSSNFTQITASSTNEALERILLERRKELLMRGLRWSDIKRFNKEGANKKITRNLKNQTYTLEQNDKRFALPLPKDIIQITGMLQNPR